jgi:hypothetical protein
MRLRLPPSGLVALAAGGLLLASCERRPVEPPARAPAAPAAEAPPAAPPAAALNRADLLDALQAAAAAYAAGRPGAQETLVGRRFVVRQAFGCQGPLTDGAAGLARWTWSKDGRAIEVSLSPVDWSRHPVFAGTSPPWEAVEGFWLARPWLRDEGCPARPAAAAPAAEAPDPAATPPPPPDIPSPQTAGVAAVFEHGGSRVGRRDGKPFAFTLRPDSSPPAPPAQGYRLVLEGRLTAFPDGRAIRCAASSPDVRPVCIAAAEVDRVAFEDADGKLLREWRPG